MSQYKNKDLTIIIVIYNSTDKIIDLLHQLNNFEIIIVNNGKNEHIISKIKAHKNVKSIISKEKNIGFGRGVNFAFENIDSNTTLDLTSQTKGILYWKHFIVLTLVFLGLEILFIRIIK